MTKWLQAVRQNSKWVLALVALAAGNALAENSKVSYPPVPTWVQEIRWTPEAGQPANPKSTGTRYLLYESQDRPKHAEEFVRVVELMENENGVQDSGSLRFGFDAEFQEVWLHRVVVHRDGKTIDRLNPSKVRLIQQEDELGGHVFTGRQTAVLFVEDLRVGDVLEYAYTIHGANPILGGHYSTRFTVQSGSPVEHDLFRVVWDASSSLQQRQHLTGSRPVIRPWNGATEYLWSFTNLPAIPYEDRQPASFEPYPYVEVSDFPDWRSVVNWALPLYDASPTNIPPELSELVDRWQSTAKSNAEKARLALEFVQDNLRYTGIELGPDSYQPANPVETFEKRFGDCKGKVVLLRFLLRQMGIESRPALVNSYVHEAIASRLPTPFAFNHVILQMQLDGKTVWVDPTCSQQGGSIWDRYLPPYGKALVIRPGNAVPEDVPRSRAEVARQQKVTSSFTIRDYEKPTGLTIRTEYRGSSADDMRDEIAGSTTQDLSKNYLNYYSRLYPGISAVSPLKFNDNRQANIVTVEESYIITNLWERDGAEKLWKASFYADNLYNVLTDPQTRLRKTPLALGFPMLRQQEVIVHLPDHDWQIPDHQTNIEHAAFSFSYQRHLRGSTATYNYECRTKLPTVPTELVPSYLASLDHMEDLLTDTLQRPDDKTPDGINWLMAVIAVFGAGATTAGCIWYWRRSKLNAAALPPLLIDNPKLQGLGGWLILIGFSLCVAPAMRVFTISQNWEGYFSIQVWQAVAMPQGASYHPLYAPLLMFELLGNTIMLGLNLLALCLFFGKRRAFPNLFIILALGNVAFLILDNIGCVLIPFLKSTISSKDHRDAIRAVFYAIIWSLYMVKSQRVKATFIK